MSRLRKWLEWRRLLRDIRMSEHYVWHTEREGHWKDERCPTCEPRG